MKTGYFSDTAPAVSSWKEGIICLEKKNVENVQAFFKNQAEVYYFRDLGCVLWFSDLAPLRM